MLDQGFGVFVESAWERDLSSENVFVDSHGVLIVEWIDSGVHFVDKDSQSPPVDGFSVALIQDDFWGDVFGGSTNGEGSAFVQYFGEPKIGEFEVTIVGDEKIFGFEVSEDDVLGVKVFEARGNSGSVESGLVGCKGFDWSEVSEKFSSVDQLQNQVQVLGVLGKSFKVDDERMADLWMNEIFIIHVIYLLGLDDFAFVEKFEGDVFSGFFVFGNFHLTEPTLTEDPSNLVVFQLQFSDSLSFPFLHGIFKIDYNQSKSQSPFIFFFYKIWIELLSI